MEKEEAGGKERKKEAEGREQEPSEEGGRKPQWSRRQGEGMGQASRKKQK